MAAGGSAPPYDPYSSGGVGAPRAEFDASAGGAGNLGATPGGAQDIVDHDGKGGQLRLFVANDVGDL